MKISKQRLIYFKIGFILFLVLLLMIPNGLLHGLIHERKGLSNQAANKIAETWGHKQQLYGPVLSVPYKRKVETNEGKFWYKDGFYHFLPDQFDIKATLNSESKKLGIYESIVYTTELQTHGNFDLTMIGDIKKANDQLFLEDAIISASVADMNAIDGDITFLQGAKNLEVNTGTPFTTMFPSGGFQVDVDIDKDMKELNFDLDIPMRGSGGIQFQPIAKSSKINLSSTWDSPSFYGRSPASEISSEGFTCEWKLNQHNRSLPESFEEEKYNFNHLPNSFGVDLIQGVDQYQKNMRSAKYAALIILLTFMVYFFFEILYKNRIHPIQYTLVGVGLTLFYFLLLSLSEHISFISSYMIAAGSITALICTYSLSLVKKKSTVCILFIIMVALYGYIFVLLQLEDFALLAGTIGLFIILSIIMFLSRKVNWYNLIGDEKTLAEA